LAACRYFEAMFSHGLRESRDDTVNFQDNLHPEVLELLLDFAYSSRIVLNEENAESLLEAGDMLQFHDVRDAAAEFLEKNLFPSNCLGMMLLRPPPGHVLEAPGTARLSPAGWVETRFAGNPPAVPRARFLGGCPRGRHSHASPLLLRRLCVSPHLTAAATAGSSAAPASAPSGHPPALGAALSFRREKTPSPAPGCLPEAFPALQGFGGEGLPEGRAHTRLPPPPGEDAFAGLGGHLFPQVGAGSRGQA
ncbi:Ectoderm-neural cortex protein 2, partial [Myotis davidii]